MNRGISAAMLLPLSSANIIDGHSRAQLSTSARLCQSCLWGPPPTQRPNRYVAVTTVLREDEPLDCYRTSFGIRSLTVDPDSGMYVNGEHIYIRGVNLHHDLGALGAAFNKRAAERQLEILREMGCNAIRTAHNPPAPEWLELTDQMGFLVVDEIFDVWQRKKTPLDFHLIFSDWHEQDLRAWIRRDRNHPSVVIWSFGNEVGEQYTGREGAAMAKHLYHIVKEEDPTRPATVAMNYAKPDMPMPAVVDVISLNYQGEGIRDASAYAGLRGITTPPMYSAFHNAFADKVVLSSENAAALSTRGTYLFPVFEGISAPVKDNSGGDPEHRYVVHMNSIRGFWGISGQGLRNASTSSFCGRRICLERLGLSGRANPLLPVTQFLFRHYRPGGVPKRPVLFVSGPLALRIADGPYSAALELAGTNRQGNTDSRFHLRRSSRTHQRSLMGSQNQREVRLSPALG